MQKRLVSLVAIAFALITHSAIAQGPFTGKPQYQIEVHRADTLMGRIVVEMFPAIAPMSVRNWDSLVNIHFYDGTAFHRVIPGFMIQGGDPNSVDGDPSTWGMGDPSQTKVKAEFSAVSHRRGILSAARVGGQPNSATSQFFICVANPTYLDRQYSVYGHVISGMDVADSIVMADRDLSNDIPYDKISMYITRLGSNDSTTPTPLASAPPDGLVTANTKTTFRWQLVPGAMMYDLQVATDAAFQNIVVDSTFNQIQSSGSISVKPGQYYWRLQANNGGHASSYSLVHTFSVQSSGVNDVRENALSVEGPFPNPATTRATIRIGQSTNPAVSIQIEDMCGRTVDSRTVKTIEPSSEITLSTNALPPGVYLCRIESEGYSVVRKLVIQ
jgi:peptidyl-prolyl cis-trans isomerase B (cyclophilin B)